MLAKIKREEELKRVNQKFGKQAVSASDLSPTTPKKSLGSETILQKTTNLMDDAELLIMMNREDRALNKIKKNRGSECLSSLKLLTGGLNNMHVDQKELNDYDMKE